MSGPNADTRTPRALTLVSIGVLLVPLALAAMAGADDAAPGVETDKACAAAKVIQAPLDPVAYDAALATFADEPGFVDLLVRYDGTGPSFTALFDLDAREDPLPFVPATLGGIPLHVVAERFEPLVIPLDQLDATWDADGAGAPPLIPQACPTAIRPGARVTTPVGGCTANFVFTDQFGRWYVGTAGHCFGALGQTLSVAGLGAVGTVVYRINGGVGSDFALVLIDADKEHLVDPAMCHWGGPTSIATGGASNVHHYGHGVGHGATTYTRPRSGNLGSGTGNSFQFTGLVSSGDSGSGALRQTDGAGVGIITHVNLGLVLFAHSAPFAYGTRLERAMDLAEGATGLQLTLQTAPLA